MLFYKTLNFITFVSLKTIRISWTFSVLLTGSLIERRWIRRTSEENELKPAHDRSVRTRTTATRSFVFAQIFRVYWLRSTREGKRNCARCFCDSHFINNGSLTKRRWIRRTSEENELKPAHDRSVRTRTTATRSFVFADDFSCLLTPINALKGKETARVVFVIRTLWRRLFILFTLFTLLHSLIALHALNSRRRTKERSDIETNIEHRTSNIARKSTLSQSLS